MVGKRNLRCAKLYHIHVAFFNRIQNNYVVLGAPSDLCRKRQIACIGAMRRYSRICVCAFARPRTRLCDESPDGDLALPCPRHAQASPASRPRHRQPCGFHRIADHERRLRGTRMSTNRFTKPTALLSLFVQPRRGAFASRLRRHSWLGGRRKPVGLERRLDGGPGKA